VSLRVGGLFAGYGGLEQGLARVLDVEPAWWSEVEPAPCAVLAHRWPDVPNLGDITKVDWTAVEPVDVITGGFPCQDVSHAGKRGGLKPTTRSGLWSHMAYAIDRLRPALVVAENVRGLLSAEADSDVEQCAWCVGGAADGEPPLRALGAVLADLAELGYDAAWCGLRAADVGAPHGRFRIFILAWPAADADRVGGERVRTARDGWARPESGRLLPTPRATRGGSTTETLTLLPTPAVNDMGDRPWAARTGAWDAWVARHKARGINGNGHGPSLAVEALRMLPAPRTENNENRQSPGYGGKDGNFHGLITGQSSWGEYAPAVARWEAVLGRPAPPPTEPTGKGGAARLSPRFVEFMMGLPDGWVTAVPGVTRSQALKALGNGVVPAQAAAAVRHLLDVRAGSLAVTA